MLETGQNENEDREVCRCDFADSLSRSHGEPDSHADCRISNCPPCAGSRLTQEVASDGTKNVRAPALTGLGNRNTSRVCLHGRGVEVTVMRWALTLCTRRLQLTHESGVAQSASEVTEKDQEPVERQLPYFDSSLEQSHGHEHCVSEARVTMPTRSSH